MSAIKANASILSFSHVNPLDVMISRCLCSFYTNSQAAAVVVISHDTWVWDAYRGTIKHLLTTIT